MYIGNDLSRGRSTLYYFDASGGETSITSATRPAVNISYTIGWVAVFLNGVRLHDTDFTANTGNSITGLAALTSGDVVIIEAAKTFSVSDSVSASNGGEFSGNVSFGDNNITNVGSISLDSISADGTEITISSDLETATNKKIKQKGEAYMHSSHQSWVLGG